MAPPVVGVDRQYLDHLRVERGLSPNTLVAYGRDVTRLVAFAAGVSVAALAVSGAADARPAATAVRLYAPFTAKGLAKGVHVAKTVRGPCRSVSLADRRADAFRCVAGGVRGRRHPRRRPAAQHWHLADLLRAVGEGEAQPAGRHRRGLVVIRAAP